jgi:hypothetical protein
VSSAILKLQSTLPPRVEIFAAQITGEASRMKRITTALFASYLLVVLFASAAHAQGRVTSPSTVTSPNATGHYSIPSNDDAIKRDRTRSFVGQIAALNVNGNSLAIKDLKTGKEIEFSLDAETKLRADKQTELAGRKNLTLADFKRGQTVRLTYRVRDAKPVEMRLRADKN